MADVDEDEKPGIAFPSTAPINLDDGDISDETQDFRLISNLVSYDIPRTSATFAHQQFIERSTLSVH